MADQDFGGGAPVARYVVDGPLLTTSFAAAYVEEPSMQLRMHFGELQQLWAVGPIGSLRAEWRPIPQADPSDPRPVKR